jgi:hypothetical protein
MILWRASSFSRLNNANSRSKAQLTTCHMAVIASQVGAWSTTEVLLETVVMGLICPTYA